MATKSKILEVIGEGKSDLLLMEKVRHALQANERVKYLLTLLQLAQNQAESPSPNPDDLSLERRRAGIDDAELDQVIPHSGLTSEHQLRIPAAGKIVSMALEETANMCEPLLVSRKPEGALLKSRLDAVGEICGPYVERVLQEPSRSEGGIAAVDGASVAGSHGPAGPGAPSAQPSQGILLPVDFIGRLTSATRGAADSLHLVVMDAHKAINSLISDISGRRESVAGADTVGLLDQDRPLVEAFMDGVNATKFLKGTHPGLAATAVRMGSRLMIQNDVGETDAHVIVMEIEDRQLEITYTDVHEKRIEFLSQLLAGLPIKWKKTESRYSSELTESAFTLCRGVLRAADVAELGNALRAIGASLVFLIDWNKARKRLRNFLRGDEVTDVLLWAARERVGHMAFLSYGDEELIYEVLEALPRGTIRRGEPLNAVLGRKASIDFLKDALRLSCESYERKEPRALLLDRIRCQLLTRVQRRGVGADEMLLELAGLAVEAALTFRDALRSVTRRVDGLIARSYERICQWEERADERLNRIRKIHLKEPQQLLPVAVYVDDALDALEDGGNLALSLEAKFDERAMPHDMVSMLEQVAELTVNASQLFFRIVHRYRELVRGGMGEPLFDLINELKQAEMAADRLKRDFRWAFLSAPGDLRALLTLRELGDAIEEAMNSFKRAGFMMHDLAYAAMERLHG